MAPTDRRSVPHRLILPSLDSDLQHYDFYLTPEELSLRWRIHPVSLRRWRSKKKGPAFVKLEDGRVLYRVSTILAYEEENTVTVNKRQRRLAFRKPENIWDHSRDPAATQLSDDNGET